MSLLSHRLKIFQYGTHRPKFEGSETKGKSYINVSCRLFFYIKDKISFLMTVNITFRDAGRLGFELRNL